jgi:hypothetical protein
VTPARYIDRRPTYTAAQWDGTEESATFILGAFAGSARRNDDGQIVVAGPTHDNVLDEGVWVYVDDRAPAGQRPYVMPDGAFTLALEPF